SGKRDVLARFWDIQRKPLIQFTNGDTGVDADGAIDVRPDRVYFNIVLVLNFADDLFNYILKSDDTFNSAMLVHDNSEMGLSVLKQTHCIVQPGGIRNEYRLSQQLRQPERLRIMEVRHQVLAMQNADNVV